MARLRSCEICGHIFAERHRVIPGKVGGIYTKNNIVWLCPNHHAAIHYVITWERKIKEEHIPLTFDARYQHYTEHDYDFGEFYNAISHSYIKALLVLRKHRCRKFGELPEDVGLAHAWEICGAISAWRRVHGKGSTYLTSKQFAKKNNINLSDDGEFYE